MGAPSRTRNRRDENSELHYRFRKDPIRCVVWLPQKETWGSEAAASSVDVRQDSPQAITAIRDRGDELIGSKAPRSGLSPERALPTAAGSSEDHRRCARR